MPNNGQLPESNIPQPFIGQRAAPDQHTFDQPAGWTKAVPPVAQQLPSQFVAEDDMSDTTVDVKPQQEPYPKS